MGTLLVPATQRYVPEFVLITAAIFSRLVFASLSDKLFSHGAR
jgi:hypothetical protein